MTTGTSLVAVKQALVTALRARPALSAVQVLYAADDFETGDDHVQEEAVWFGNANWIESEIPVWNTGTKKVDETYAIDWTLQVVKPDGTNQETADVRARVLLAEFQQALAETPRISAEILWAYFRVTRHSVGQFVAGPGHGARFTGVIEVRARLAP